MENEDEDGGFVGVGGLDLWSISNMANPEAERGHVCDVQTPEWIGRGVPDKPTKRGDKLIPKFCGRHLSDVPEDAGGLGVIFAASISNLENIGGGVGGRGRGVEW